MTDESVHLDTETVEPDRFMGPTRYKMTLRCLRCGKEYSKIVAKVTSQDPPCPRKKCREAALDEEVERRARNMAAIIESGQAPGHIGANVTVKAVDATAEIVMQDYKLGDLKSGIRHGESAAPPLPPPQQALADGYFGGEGLRKRMGINQRQMNLIGKRAIAGAYRNMAINPGAVLPGHQGEPALRLVRRESLK